MQRLTQKDLWPLPVYQGVRDQFRREVIAAKQDRRLSVGPYMTYGSRISAVQYVRFPVGPEAAALLAEAKVHAALVIDHPNYTHRLALTEGMCRSLAKDLAPEQAR